MVENSAPTPKSEPQRPAELPPKLNGAPPPDQPEVNTDAKDKSETSGNPGISEPEAAADGFDKFEFKPVVVAGGKDEPLPKDFDPFVDLERIREKSAIGTTVPVTKNRLSIPAERPGKHHFFRVHPDPDFTIEVTLLEYDRSLFYVDHDLFGTLVEMGLSPQPYRLYPYMTRAQDWGVWPVRIPGENGRDWSWWSTAHEVAMLARGDWLRASANQGTNAYEYFRPETKFADPVWPDMPLNGWLRLAFPKDRRILGVDHFIVQQLAGRQ